MCTSSPRRRARVARHTRHPAFPAAARTSGPPLPLPLPASQSPRDAVEARSGSFVWFASKLVSTDAQASALWFSMSHPGISARATAPLPAPLAASVTETGISFCRVSVVASAQRKSAKLRPPPRPSPRPPLFGPGHPAGGAGAAATLGESDGSVAPGTLNTVPKRWSGCSGGRRALEDAKVAR